MCENGSKQNWLGSLAQYLTPVLIGFMIWQIQGMSKRLDDTRDLVLTHISAYDVRTDYSDGQIKALEVWQEEIDEWKDDKDDKDDDQDDALEDLNGEAILPSRDDDSKKDTASL